MMTSQVLRTLETRGLVSRTAHPTDSRARQLAVTAAGSALAGRAIAAVEDADRSFFEPARGRRSIADFMRILGEL
jgi:DNA-binding MarR family transcriptional regulator